LSDYSFFSSVDVDESESFAAYERLCAPNLRVAPTRAPFHAEVKSWKLDGMHLFDQRLSGMSHVRDISAKVDGFDYIVVHAVVSGELEGSEASRFDRVGAGEIVLLEGNRPSRTQARGVHLMSVRVARHLVETALGEGLSVHGKILRPPECLILFDYIASLVRWAGDLAGSRQPFSCGLVDLLVGPLATDPAGGVGGKRREYILRQAVERYISANLADRALSVGTIAAAVGISRSALYRLLGSHGGVARLIWVRRLAALRSALDAGSRHTLARLAEEFGFASEAHMSRLFSATFGHTPGAYRAKAREERFEAGQGAARSTRN
jgi:AraC-like DNA-binding protein